MIGLIYQRFKDNEIRSMVTEMISAGIVLYHPNCERLFENINIIRSDVDRVYLYDNGTPADLLDMLTKDPLVTILGDGNNIGLAKALNCIMKRACADGSRWVITYDQDSISDCRLIQEYRKLLDIPNLAIICPQVIDRRRKYMEEKRVHSIESVTRCITSASCTSVKAWEEVGGFDDFLFIDLIDNDFCKRLKLKDWDILRLNDVVLNQEYGNIEPKDKKTVDYILKVSSFIKRRLHMNYLAENIGKLSYKKNVSPLRVYYTNRNVIYLNKKFKKHGGIGYDCYRCRSYLGFQICFNLASLCRGKEKIKIFKAIVNGMKDGIKSSPKVLP